MLTQPGHVGRTYRLDGPGLLTMPQVAAVLARQLAHRVRAVHLPAPVFGRLLRITGSDPWLAEGLVRQFVYVVRPDSGEERQPSTDVEQVTGSAATSLDDFVRQNRSQFA